MKRPRCHEFQTRVLHFKKSTLGPETIQALGRWPQQYCDILEKLGHLESIARLLRHGGLGTTDFSGIDAPAEGWASLRDVLHDRVGWEEGRGEMLSWVRSCDCMPEVKQILISKSGGRACVFGNILDRLPVEAQEWLKARLATLETAKPDSLEWQRTQDHICTFIEENETWLFPREATSRCASHDAECFVQPLVQWEKARSLPPEERSQKRAWWCAECNDSDVPPLGVDVSGPPCTDYAGTGLQLKSNGKQQIWHELWAAMRRMFAKHLTENVFFFENVWKYPADKLALKLDATHEVRHAVESPDNDGFPVRRVRTNMCGVNRLTHVWTGPSQEDFPAALQDFRGRACELTGDAFCVAPAEDINAMILEMSKERNTSLPRGWEEKPMVEIMSSLLPIGAIDRLAEHEAVRLESMAKEGADIVIVDLEQHPGSRGPQGGALWPAMLTHHQMYNFVKQRLTTPGESFAAQGLDWFPEVSGGRQVTALKSIVEKLPHHMQKHAVGNSMHVPSIISFMLFCFAHIRSKADLEKLSPAMPAASADDDDAANSGALDH